MGWGRHLSVDPIAQSTINTSMTPVLRSPEQYSRCGLTRDEYRVRITFPFLLASLFLMQPRWTLTFSFFCIVDSWPQGLPRPFLQSCFPSGCPPACAGAWGSSFPGAGVCTLLCSTKWGSCQPISPDWWGASALLRVVYHQESSWGCTLPHHLNHWWREYYSFPVLLFSHYAEPFKEKK